MKPALTQRAFQRLEQALKNNYFAIHMSSNEVLLHGDPWRCLGYRSVAHAQCSSPVPLFHNDQTFSLC